MLKWDKKSQTKILKFRILSQQWRNYGEAVGGRKLLEVPCLVFFLAYSPDIEVVADR